jgi:magnesium-transporting ATPase (P-type)
MEAMLTGESVPANKVTIPAKLDAGIGDRTCMGYR